MATNHRQAVDPFASRSRDPLAAMRDRWVMCVVLAIALAAAGFGLSTTHQTQITAEARLAVGSNSLQAYQVAGFAVASEALAANYARFVSGSPATSKALEDSLHGRTEEIVSISASPIPDSNVVRIEATATDSEVALAAAGAVAKSLVERVNAGSAEKPGELLDEHQQLSSAVVRQQSKVDRLIGRRGVANLEGRPTDEIEAVLAQAKARLATLQLRQTATGVAYQQTFTQPTVENGLREIQPAAISGDDERQTQQLYTASGLLVGLLLGLVLSNLLEGGARRRELKRLSSSTGEESEPINRSRHDTGSTAEPSRSE